MHNWIARLGLLLALTGCEALADQQSEGVALATLHGTLSLGQGVKPPVRNLRVSVLWEDPKFTRYVSVPSTDPDEPLPIVGADPLVSCGDGLPTGWRIETHLLEQPVQLSTNFPSGFSVRLTEPPPPAALFEFPDGSGLSDAFGDVVVYDDRNGNNRLDPSTFDAPSPDQIFGSSQGVNPWGIGQRNSYKVVYLSQDADTAEGDGKAGYSLEIEDPSNPGPGGGSAQRLSEAMIDLTLDPTTYVQQTACAVRCNVPVLDWCDDPKGYLAGDLGARFASDLGVGSSAWSRQDGDSNIFTLARCAHARDGQGNVRAYSLELGVTKTQGCTQMSGDCITEVGAASPDAVDLPCTEYGEMMPSVPAQPADPP